MQLKFVEVKVKVLIGCGAVSVGYFIWCCVCSFDVGLVHYVTCCMRDVGGGAVCHLMRCSVSSLFEAVHAHIIMQSGLLFNAVEVS